MKAIAKIRDKPELDYRAYRKATGKCETCGMDMASHLICDACGGLLGPEHESVLCSYREHNLCELCIKAWEHLDSILCRQTTFEEFKKVNRKLEREILCQI